MLHYINYITHNPVYFLILYPIQKQPDARTAAKNKIADSRYPCEDELMYALPTEIVNINIKTVIDISNHFFSINTL